MLTLIAMPVYGKDGLTYEGLDGLVATHLDRVCATRGFVRMNNGIVDRARCELVGIFLDSNADRLLFWDSDVAMHAETVSAMEQMSDAGEPIVVAPYIRRGGKDFVTRGMGATMLRRDLLEQVRADHPELLFQSGIAQLGLICGMFLPQVKEGQYLAEDAAFFERAGKPPAILSGHEVYHAGVWGTYDGH